MQANLFLIPIWCTICNYRSELNPLLFHLSNIQDCVTAGEWTVIRQRPSVHLCQCLQINFLLVWWMLPALSTVSLVLLFLFCCWSKRPEDWEESIFVQHKEYGYRLRDNVHFHMYISTSPCGDGRLNSPYEITSDSKTLFIFILFNVFLLWFSSNISYLKPDTFVPADAPSTDAGVLWMSLSVVGHAALTKWHFIMQPLRIYMI